MSSALSSANVTGDLSRPLPPRAMSDDRPARFPISRWYLYPLAVRLADRLATSRVRPSQVTLLGLGMAALGAGVLLTRPAWAPVAAMCVGGAWFCDRIDGLLARRQGRATAWGAWLDANVDELVDLGLHIALAAAAASSAAWGLLIGFLLGKYLLMYGLSCERGETTSDEPAAPAAPEGWLRRLYHLPGNADVRLHLLLAALLTGYWTTELALVAVYYNLRWIVRYVLVARRLGVAR